MGSDDGLERIECPNCGRGFDAVREPFASEGILCPYCGAEIEN